MKATELRIGNFISHFEEERTVLKIERQNSQWYIGAGNDINSLSNAYNVQDAFKPITLTEEWLIKFGWIWNEETNTFEKFPNGDARMHLTKTSFGFNMFNYVLKAEIARKIYYVHQLQNLFFALTGEELKIKELA